MMGLRDRHLCQGLFGKIQVDEVSTEVINRIQDEIAASMDRLAACVVGKIPPPALTTIGIPSAGAGVRRRRGRDGTDGQDGTPVRGVRGQAGTNGTNGRTVFTVSGFFSGSDNDSIYLQPASSDCEMNGNFRGWGMTFAPTKAWLWIGIEANPDGFEIDLVRSDATVLLNQMVNPGAASTGMDDSGELTPSPSIAQGNYVGLRLDINGTPTGTLAFYWNLYLYD